MRLSRRAIYESALATDDKRIIRKYKDFKDAPWREEKYIDGMPILYLLRAYSDTMPSLPYNVVVFLDESGLIEMVRCPDLESYFGFNDPRQYATYKNPTFRSRYFTFRNVSEFAIYKNVKYYTPDSLYYRLFKEMRGQPLENFAALTQDCKKILVRSQPGVVFKHFNDQDMYEAFRGVVLKIFYPCHYNPKTGDFEVNVSIRSAPYDIQLRWLYANKNKLIKFVVRRIEERHKKFMNRIGTFGIYRISDMTLTRESLIELRFAIKDEFIEIFKEENEEEDN